MNKSIMRSGMAATAVALLFTVGCSPKVTRTVDVSQGEYYTAEEFKNLSKEQYEAYCASLEAELAGLESQAGSLNGPSFCGRSTSGTPAVSARRLVRITARNRFGP